MPSQETIEKLPPQSLEAEMAVLGSMLLDREATALAIEMLNQSYFYKDAHKKIYSAIIKIFDENRAVDLITVVEELKRNNALDEVGGPSYITGIASGVPTAANIVHYVKIVKEKYILRNLINASTQIAAECYNTSHDADTLIDKAEQIIFDIASKKVESRSVPLRDIIRLSLIHI